MKKHLGLLVVFILILSLWACAPGGSAPSAGEPGGAAEEEAPAEEASTGGGEVGPLVGAEGGSFAAGDVVELQGFRLILNKFATRGELVRGNFTLENTGEQDLAFKGSDSMKAKGADGTDLVMERFTCSSTDLDGVVAPGEQMTGDICFKMNGATGIVYYYDASAFGSGVIEWPAPAE